MRPRTTRILADALRPFFRVRWRFASFWSVTNPPCSAAALSWSVSLPLRAAVLAASIGECRLLGDDAPAAGGGAGDAGAAAAAPYARERLGTAVDGRCNGLVSSPTATLALRIALELGVGARSSPRAFQRERVLKLLHTPKSTGDETPAR